MTLIRSIVASYSEDDVRKGDALVKQIKVYPLAKTDNPPKLRLVDMTDIIYDGLPAYDETFYTSLARVLNEAVTTQRPRNAGQAPATRHREGQGIQPRCCDRGPVETGGPRTTVKMLVCTGGRQRSEAGFHTRIFSGGMDN